MAWTESRWRGLSPNGVDWVQMVWTESKWRGLSPNGVDWVQMVWTESKWRGLSPNGVDWVQMVWTESKWCELSPNGVDWVQMINNDIPCKSLLSKIFWRFSVKAKILCPVKSLPVWGKGFCCLQLIGLGTKELYFLAQQKRRILWPRESLTSSKARPCYVELETKSSGLWRVKNALTCVRRVLFLIMHP